MFMITINYFAWGYRYITKPVLFLFPPEFIHESITSLGEFFGRSSSMRFLFRKLFTFNDQRLTQEIAGIPFVTPVGLAAGFDYEAKLTQILPAVGFGFQTVGTITNNPYGGNPPPMLGRLPKSRSLMVNKGFKNLGITVTLRKLSHKTFGNAVGISIGRTNTKKLVKLRSRVYRFRIMNSISVARICTVTYLFIHQVIFGNFLTLLKNSI
jgi:dihydroorotate dehydrogenase